MKQVEWYHIAFLGIAIILEIIANIALKYSNGFKNRILGVFSIFCVLLAFTALAQAVKAMDLSVAYAVWGGFGILATVITGWILFQQRLKPVGWVGLALLLVGMSLLKLT